jgi:antitoxin Phd
MRRSTWSIQDAKNSFSSVVEAARREPQTVTKHGKPAVVVVAADQYARLCQQERGNAGSFKQHLLAFPKGDAEFPRLEGTLRDIDL